MARAGRRVPDRVKVLVLGGLLILLVFDIVYEAGHTLKQLDIVEAERDGWQKPLEVIRALDLKPGNTVVDLGCGSGYFTLKLSRTIGDRGKVLAVDIRRLPLAFLRVRTWLKGSTNVETVFGEPDDPHLRDATVDGALIVNTYHELQQPRTILNHTFSALVSGGRLVIADRSSDSERHQVSLSAVDAEVRDSGFQVTQRIDSFIDNPKNGQWWLLTARKP